MALKNHIPAQAALRTFMLERVLKRIPLSKCKDMVIHKEEMLIVSMVGISNRTTIDMDAMLRGYPLSEETIRETLSEICVMQLDDEVIFDHVIPT